MAVATPYLPPELASGLDIASEQLLRALADAENVTFIQPGGNIGDILIYEGARQLLAGAGIEARYIYAQNPAAARLRGDVAVIAGGGAWCSYFDDTPGILARVERQFSRVVVYPSSFERTETVARALARTRARVFAREPVSYGEIHDLCESELAHDTAFYFDFGRWRARRARGTLHAYRTDSEAVADRPPLPASNLDVSRFAASLEHWLSTIARARTVYTDRAHVMIAAALLGRRVYYRSSGYHKVAAIASWSLNEFPVTRIA